MCCLTVKPLVLLAAVCICSEAHDGDVSALLQALRTGSSETPGQLRIPLKRRPSETKPSGGSTGPVSFLQTASKTSRERPESRAEGNAFGLPSIDVFGTIRVGTPAQTFDVAIDTGSSNLLLTSADCSSLGCLSHKTYSPKASETARPLSLSQGKDGETVLLDISTGEAEGDLVEDTVCLGEEGDVCAKTGLVQMTRMTEKPFANFPFDGILGVGMPGGSLDKRFNFMSLLAENGALKRDRFSVWMANENDTENSEIIFGEVAEDRLGSELLWMPISRLDTGMWQTKMDDFTIDNTPLGLCGTVNGCEAAFDTGTNAIAAPEHMISTLLTALDIKQDCSNYNSLPPLGVKFAGQVLKLDKRDYVKRVLGDHNVQCYHQFLPMELSGKKKDLILLGDPFMKRYYTVFDRESLNIGLASAKHNDAGAAHRAKKQRTQY